MTEKKRRQFGLWDSPITASSLAAGRRLDGVAWDTDGETVVWLEGRSGHGVLVSQSSLGDAACDLTSDLSVRAKVGYGGGDSTVADGHVYFAAHLNGQLYRQRLSEGAARPVTSSFGSACSPAVSPDGASIAYVHNDGVGNDRIAVVDSEGKHWPQVLVSGHDFFMQPRWSPDGRRLCWIAWDHPNMPWDGTTLYVADVLDGSSLLPRLGEARAIAGGSDIAIFQPEFIDDRRIAFISDETGSGRIAEYDLETSERRWLTPDGIEHGLPAWRFGMRTYVVIGDGRTLVAARNVQGFQSLWQIDLDTLNAEPIQATEDYTEITDIAAAPARRRFAFIGSRTDCPPRVVQHDLETGTSRVLARAAAETIPAAALSKCEPISWKTNNAETVHGLFFPPAGQGVEGIGKPPLIAMIHGGPTSQVRAGWKPDAQFFATRGYAVLYVNYRGSTGYGRNYMLKLRGNWGICDVEDAISGKEALVAEGRIDPHRTVIMGGSAGGFTVLHALSQHPQSFTAGVSLYGVADQFHLAAQTHKFESRYLDTMLGPLPEAASVYRERSPVYHADRITRPLAIFQGEIDRVVPQAQSDAIVEALKRTGSPHIYHVYKDEGHGWRKRETIEHFYHAVEEFLKTHVLYT
ncbi:MAG: S9 family peptidase [Planctomycetaceae bacterium]|jgi:dipeptidyl aminopeptidase/acylaminoacyl peptidase|nr:S9 family peptidase [Planctomycetaceae bacterium]MBT6484346.1 S9 family peptidase [Planctomycetaceae bacterium]MBT6498079.1 S9 family peptidase [Planctomycetaceae bacterium]